MNMQVFDALGDSMSAFQLKYQKHSIWKILKDWYHKAITVVQHFRAISWLIGLLAMYGIADALVFGLRISRWMIEPTTKRIIPINPLSILLLLLGLSLLLMQFAYIFLLKNQKLSYKFGFFWDKGKTPHCPACKSVMHLVKSEKYPGLMELCCRQCNYQTQIFDVNDVEGDEVETVLTLTEAQEML